MAGWDKTRDEITVSHKDCTKSRTT